MEAWGTLYAADHDIDMFKGEIGITFLRKTLSADLLQALQEAGISYRRIANGVYEVSLISCLSVQIAVMGELDDESWRN